MVIGVAVELGRGLEPVKVPAEGLNGVKFADDGQPGFIVRDVRRMGGSGRHAGRIARGRGVWHVCLGVVIYCPSE